jgi:hypothetical protein
VSDGFDGVEPAWSLNFRFAGQYCSVWQIKAGLAADFRIPGTIVTSVYWIYGSDNLGNPYAEKMLRRRSQPIHE